MRTRGPILAAGTLALSAIAAVFAQSGGKYELIGRVGDSDAQRLSGGRYELAGAIMGRSAVSGGAYSLTGEFSASVKTPARVLCPGDLLEPSGVGVEDLLELLNSWGEADSPADLDGDETVGILDLLTLLANWGARP